MPWWSAVPGSAVWVHSRCVWFVLVALPGGCPPVNDGILETIALQRSGALEHGIGGGTKMRVDALEIAQDVHVQGVRLDGFGSSFAQAHEVALGGCELPFPQL